VIIEKITLKKQQLVFNSHALWKLEYG